MIFIYFHKEVKGHWLNDCIFFINSITRTQTYLQSNKCGNEMFIETLKVFHANGTIKKCIAIGAEE